MATMSVALLVMFTMTVASPSSTRRPEPSSPPSTISNSVMQQTSTTITPGPAAAQGVGTASGAGDGAAPLEVTTKTPPSRVMNMAAGQLVKCHCGPEEVLTAAGCRPYPEGTSIDGEGREDFHGPHVVPKSVTDLNVIVQDLSCDVEDDHRQMNFTKGQFFLRDRGDIVLTDDAGYLSGLRIENYCVSHLLDDQKRLTWMMKGCIPPPSIPRCCPEGQTFSSGVCSPARSPHLLIPPLSAGLDKSSVMWPVVRNHHNPISCTADPLKTLPVGSIDSYLMSLPHGVIHVWNLPNELVKKKYTFTPDFCVDQQHNVDGSLTYTANLCYSDPREKHHRICKGNICVRKCCNDNQIMDFSIHRCIDYSNVTFKSPFTTTLSYKIVKGMPLCKPQTLVNNFTLDNKGNLIYKSRVFPPTDYCLDTFHNAQGNLQNSALACLTSLSKWDQARLIVFPACQVISLLSMSLTVACYCKIPELLKNGGWYQLWHVLSLMLAYSSNLTQRITNKYMNDLACVVMALLMQFGYLATFFWLSVLCFEVWRKVRSLSRYLPPTVVAVWVYPLYAFGGPSLIGIITICMQFLAPDNVPGLHKPYIGEARCWFIGDLELFLYFYGPIAFLFACNIFFIGHTYWNYKTFEANSAVLRNFSIDKSGTNATVQTSLDQVHRRRDYISDFKQQFSLLVLMSICWITEILSWKIPPDEMWAVTDILNTLQGFIILLIFLANKSKRKHLKKKYPGPFVAANHLKMFFKKCGSFLFCSNENSRLPSQVCSINSKVSRKISTSSIVSSISTLTSTLKSTSSSFHVTSPDKSDPKRHPSVSESEDGILTLSHSPLCSLSSNGSETSL